MASSPLLAKMKLAPQIVQAIKSWQYCTATAYKAQRRAKIGKDDAAENGLPPDAVRMALNNAKMNLKIHMTARD